MLHDTDIFGYWTDLIARRRTTRWYPVFGEIYEALGWAIEVFSLKTQWVAGLTQAMPELFDLHRTSTGWIKPIEDSTWLMTKLRDLTCCMVFATALENIYVNWFLQKLGSHGASALKKNFKVGG